MNYFEEFKIHFADLYYSRGFIFTVKDLQRVMTEYNRHALICMSIALCDSGSEYAREAEDEVNIFLKKIFICEKAIQYAEAQAKRKEGIVYGGAENLLMSLISLIEQDQLYIQQQSATQNQNKRKNSL